MPDAPDDRIWDVADIVADWLTAHGYDGLCCDYCSCTIETLFACGYNGAYSCRAGHFVPCPGPEQCDFTNVEEHRHIGDRK